VGVYDFLETLKEKVTRVGRAFAKVGEAMFEATLDYFTDPDQ
jgi:hypothetical protein